MSIWRKLDNVNTLTTSLDNKVGMADGLAMRLGLLPGVTRRLLIGDILATNQETTVGGGIDPGEILEFDRSGPFLAIASTSANDSIALGPGPAGFPGAQVVLVRYIDANGDEQLQTFNLFGQTKVTLTSPAFPTPGTPIPMQCINFIGVALTGTTETNEGRIYIGRDSDTFTAGKPDTRIWNVVEVARAVNNSIHNMIPAAVTTHLIQITFSSDSTEKNDGLVVHVRTQQAILETGGFVSRNALDIHILGNITLNGIAFPGFTPGSVFSLTSQTAGGAVVGVSVSVAMADVRNDVYPPTTEGPIIG